VGSPLFCALLERTYYRERAVDVLGVCGTDRRWRLLAAAHAGRGRCAFLEHLPGGTSGAGRRTRLRRALYRMPACLLCRTSAFTAGVAGSFFCAAGVLRQTAFPAAATAAALFHYHSLLACQRHLLRGAEGRLHYAGLDDLCGSALLLYALLPRNLLNNCLSARYFLPPHTTCNCCLSLYPLSAANPGSTSPAVISHRAVFYKLGLGWAGPCC